MATLADALRQTGYSQDGTLVSPSTDSPMTKALSEHIKTLPQQLATNQAALDSAIGSWNKTDFATGQPNPNYRPEAIQELTQFLPNFAGMIAYHGTPHTIKGQFDISKVGTGEGAQAYGHGMYFAENPAVAKEYADMDTKVAKSLLKINEGDAYKALQDAEKQAEYIKQKMSPSQQTIESNQKTIDYLKNKWLKDQEITGNLYKVDIPDEHIPMMLEWDKPISQMSPEMQKEIRRIAKEEYLPLEYQNAKKHGDLTGKHFYHELSKLFDTYEGASQVLNSEGIKGIRYLDAGSRPTNIMDTRLESLYQKHGGDIQKAADDFMRTIHESPKKKAEIRAGIIKDLENRPTSNFVVFDPSTVKILEENSKPVSRKELIEKQIKALKD